MEHNTTFDARTVEPAVTFEPVPTDWYKVVIDDSEMKPTKDGKGAYLEAALTIVEGPFAKRKAFLRLNINNANPVAQEIAFKQLSAICHAAGVIQININWSGKPAVPQLHGIALMARITKKAAEGSYDAVNEVKGFKAIAGVGLPVGAGAPAPAAAPAWATQPTTPPIAPAGPAPVAVNPAVAPASPGAVPPWAQPAAMK